MRDEAPPTTRSDSSTEHPDLDPQDDVAGY